MEEPKDEVQFRKFKDAFSYQIIQYKNTRNYESFVDAVLDFLQDDIVQKEYDWVCWSNLKDYINDELKHRLFIDFKEKRMIASKYKGRMTNKLFS